MKKRLLLIILIIFVGMCARAQYQERKLLGFIPGTNVVGWQYNDTLRGRYLAHPLYAINDTTAGFDSASYYISGFGRNATNDSIILSFLNGRRLAVLAGTSGSGGGATAAGSTYQIQYNGGSATFAASPFYTFNPSVTATSGIATGLYIGNHTVTASNNNDILAGVSIDPPNYVTNPSGTNYSNTQQYALRVGGVMGLYGKYTPLPLIGGTTSTGFIVRRNLLGSGLIGATFMDTLTATDNSASLIGVQINPVFVNGAFSATNTSLQVQGNTALQNTTVTGTLLTTSSAIFGSSTGAANGIQIMPFGSSYPVMTIYSSFGTTRLGVAEANDSHWTGTIGGDVIVQMVNNGSKGFFVGRPGAIGGAWKIFSVTGSVLQQNGGTFTEDTSSLYTINTYQKGVLWPRAISAVKEGIKTGILSFSSQITGSGYTQGTYTNVPLTGGNGSGALATISVNSSGSAIASLTYAGNGYAVGDILSATGFGAGSGFSVTVGSLKYAAKGLMMIDTSTAQVSINNGVNMTGSVITSNASTLNLQHGTDYVFNGSTATYTLPAVNSNILGRQNEIHIINEGSGAITVNSNSGSTIYTTSLTSSITIAAGATAVLFPTGSNFKVKFNQ